MATMITSECINCGACEPECPNTAIYQGGVEWQALDGVHAPGAVERDLLHRPREVHRVRRLPRPRGLRRGLSRSTAASRIRTFRRRTTCCSRAPACCIPRRPFPTTPRRVSRRAPRARLRPRPASEGSPAPAAPPVAAAAAPKAAAPVARPVAAARAKVEKATAPPPSPRPPKVFAHELPGRLRSDRHRARRGPAADDVPHGAPAAVAAGRRAGRPRGAAGRGEAAHRGVDRRHALLQRAARDRGQRVPESLPLSGRWASRSAVCERCGAVLLRHAEVGAR